MAACPDCQQGDIRVPTDNSSAPAGFKGIHVVGGAGNRTGPSPGEPRARSQVRGGLLGLYCGSSAGSPGTYGGDAGKREGPESPEGTLGGRFVLDTKKFDPSLAQILNVPQRDTDLLYKSPLHFAK